MPPLASRMQRRRAFFRRLRWYGYFAGVALLLTGLTYLCVYSPMFRITEVKIVGAGQMQTEALLAALKVQVAASPLGWLGNDNYLAWPDELPYRTAQVQNISIQKSFLPRSITIHVTPRTRYAVWCNDIEARQQSCYWVDPNGIIFERAPIAEGQLVQTIYDDASGAFGLIGEPVLAESSFQIVKKVVEGTQALGLAVRRMRITHELQELRVDTEQGARILFSLRFDPEPTALPALARFMKKPGLTRVEYLNLTVENRAYVKHK